MTALVWRKSTRTLKENCVEVAFTSDFVAVRDSKDPHGPQLRVSPATFRVFLRSLR